MADLDAHDPAPHGRRSALAAVGLLVGTALTVLAVIGALAMLFTFAGVCGPDDDCDSWKRRQLPFLVGVGIVAAVGALTVGVATVAARRQTSTQITLAVASIACTVAVLALEWVYLTR